MRKSMIASQSNASRDELLINFKQGEEIAPVDSLLTIWASTWSKFENDAFSYIVPAIDRNQEMADQNVKIVGHGKSKHTFSFAYSTRQLKRVITMYSGLDVFPEIRKEITRIFYRIANYFVTNSLKPDSQNLFLSIVQGYNKIQSKLAIVIGCLNLVLNKFITRKGIEDEIYSIINKELMNHVLYQKFINSCMFSIDSLRNSCLTVREGLPSSGCDHKDVLEINKQIIQNIALFNKLKIFPFIEYLERSKKYYSELLSKIPKNVSMFSVLHNFVRCQKVLQNIIAPDEQKIEQAKKNLKRENWRAIEIESMIKVFCKQILDQMYEDMIEYVDYLIDVQGEKDQKRKLQNKLAEKILSSDQKKQYLKHLWQLTKVLQRNLANQKQNFNKIQKDKNGNRQNKQHRYISPSTKLLNRITTIIADIKKYIVTQTNQQSKGKQAYLYKVISFKNNLISVTSSCFDNDPKFVNAIMNAIQESIVEEEDNYNTQLCSIILSPLYVFPGTTVEERQMIEQVQMIDESEENMNSNRVLNNKFSYQLFKLTPSKEQFVRKFEQEFSNYVLPFTEGKLDLSQQQKFIKTLQKQCGHIISRNIERMLNDVWKNGQMVFYKYQAFVCRILCIDWPNFPQSRYRLADGLLEVRANFQIEFLSQPQNEKKKLRWIEECGKITLAIMGVQSVFSELQASIIILLSKSYRPIRAQQFKQVLQYVGTDIQMILQELAQKNIVTFNEDAGNYELNYENKSSCSFEAKQKSIAKKQKKAAQRDYGIIVQALIARILKRRKSVQKTDLAKLLSSQARTDIHQPTIQEINNALERLKAKDIINVEKTRGIIKYIQ